MRKKRCEVTDRVTIDNILARCRVGRFGTNGGDGYPYIVPVNFVYLQESIYFHCSRQGEKMDNVLRDPRCCFEADIPLAYLDTGHDPEKPPCMVSQFYHSVIIRGRAEVIEDREEKLTALNALMASHENDPGFSAITGDMAAVDICAVVAIRVDSLTAKSNFGQSATGEERRKIADYLYRRNLPGDREAAELMGS